MSWQQAPVRAHLGAHQHMLNSYLAPMLGPFYVQNVGSSWQQRELCTTHPNPRSTRTHSCSKLAKHGGVMLDA
jgi:hypothetical protein